MDAPPDHDPLPGILEQLERTAERLRADPDWKEPTEAEKVDYRRGDRTRVHGSESSN
jgi:hypothetical protein